MVVGAWGSVEAAQTTSRVVWRAVPAGVVTLGTHEGRPDERPPHQVHVAAFRVMLTEATVAQYRTCHAAGGCTTPRGHSGVSPEGMRLNWGAEGRERHPINGISWAQASAFCAWAGGRLPRESEWVRAARDRHLRRYPWGDGAPGPRAPLLANVADAAARVVNPSWKTARGYDDGFAATAPVAQFILGRSPAGVFDMAGNVWEWTADRYDPEGYKRARRPSAPNLRAARGGSFSSPPERATTQARRGLSPKAAPDDVGVRCVTSPLAPP